MAATEQTLATDKAARIVDAMRHSVAKRGVAGSTFDVVAREAGVSRGLLHYHFGTKERLLVEAVRRDCDLRIDVLEQQLAGARDSDDFLALLVYSLEELVATEPDFFTVIFELFTLSRRNEEIAVEFADLLRRQRDHVADLLAAKAAEGVLRLHAEPTAVADLLFAIGDGIALRMLAEPERDWRPTIDAGVAAVRRLIADPA